ncbi:MAG: hypothetical protein RL756_2338, partial [Pseudomonadota bacterium]
SWQEFLVGDQRGHLPDMIYFKAVGR